MSLFPYGNHWLKLGRNNHVLWALLHWGVLRHPSPKLTPTELGMALRWYSAKNTRNAQGLPWENHLSFPRETDSGSKGRRRSKRTNFYRTASQLSHGLGWCPGLISKGQKHCPKECGPSETQTLCERDRDGHKRRSQREKGRFSQPFSEGEWKGVVFVCVCLSVCSCMHTCCEEGCGSKTLSPHPYPGKPI